MDAERCLLFKNKISGEQILRDSYLLSYPILISILLGQGLAEIFLRLKGMELRL
jgi:hypothetical protein